MRTHNGTIRLSFAFAALLAAMTLVIWRQSRALELLRGVDGIRGERVIAEAERSELGRRIQHLESRARVVADARSRLSMHVPSANEIVILPLNPAGSAPALPTGHESAAPAIARAE